MKGRAIRYSVIGNLHSMPIAGEKSHGIPKRR